MAVRADRLWQYPERLLNVARLGGALDKDFGVSVSTRRPKRRERKRQGSVYVLVVSADGGYREGAVFDRIEVEAAAVHAPEAFATRERGSVFRIEASSPRWIPRSRWLLFRWHEERRQRLVYIEPLPLDGESEEEAVKAGRYRVLGPARVRMVR